MTWAELLTQDPEGSLKFYGEVFGWTSVAMEMPTGNLYMIMAGDRPVSGLVQLSMDEVPTQWNC